MACLRICRCATNGLGHRGDVAHCSSHTPDCHFPTISNSNKSYSVVNWQGQERGREREGRREAHTLGCGMNLFILVANVSNALRTHTIQTRTTCISQRPVTKCVENANGRALDKIAELEEAQQHNLKVAPMSNGQAIVYCCNCYSYLQNRTQLLYKPCKCMERAHTKNDAMAAKRRLTAGRHPESHADKSIQIDRYHTALRMIFKQL